MDGKVYCNPFGIGQSWFKAIVTKDKIWIDNDSAPILNLETELYTRRLIHFTGGTIALWVLDIITDIEALQKLIDNYSKSVH